MALWKKITIDYWILFFIYLLKSQLCLTPSIRAYESKSSVLQHGFHIDLGSFFTLVRTKSVQDCAMKCKLEIKVSVILEVQIDVRSDILGLCFRTADTARKNLKLLLIQDNQQRFEERCQDQGHKKVKTTTKPGQGLVISFGCRQHTLNQMSLLVLVVCLTLLT